MSPVFAIYFVDTFSNISYLLPPIIEVSVFLFVAIFVITTINRLISGNDEDSIKLQNDCFFKPFKKYFWIPCILMIINCFIPSEKTLYMMIGANYLENHKIPDKISSIIDNKLQEYLTEKKDKTNG